MKAERAQWGHRSVGDCRPGAVPGGTATRLLALDPLQEAVHRTLMTSMPARNVAPQFEQYQVCAGLLKRELGAEPELQTRTALTPHFQFDG